MDGAETVRHYWFNSPQLLYSSRHLRYVLINQLGCTVAHFFLPLSGVFVGRWIWVANLHRWEATVDVNTEVRQVVLLVLWDMDFECVFAVFGADSWMAWFVSLVSCSFLSPNWCVSQIPREHLRSTPWPADPNRPKLVRRQRFVSTLNPVGFHRLFIYF